MVFMMMHVMNNPQMQSVEYAARRAIELRPAAFASIYANGIFEIWFFGAKGQILGQAGVVDHIDSIKISPDGAMAVALRNTNDPVNNIKTGHLVISSKERRLAVLEVRDIVSVNWCDGDVLIRTQNRILRWYRDRLSDTWKTQPLGATESAITTEGSRYWKVSGGQLYEMLGSIALNTIPVSRREPSSLCKIQDSPFMLRTVWQHSKLESLEAKLFLLNLQAGSEKLISEQAIGTSNVVMAGGNMLLYFRLTEHIRGKLVMRSLDEAKEETMGEEVNLPSLYKLSKDHVMIVDRGTKEFLKDRIFVFQPFSRKMIQVKIPAMGDLYAADCCE